MFFSLDKPRTDCPDTLPTPPKISGRKNIHEQPLHDLQRLMVKLIADINGENPKDIVLKNEQEGAVYIEKQVKKLLSKTKK